MPKVAVVAFADTETEAGAVSTLAALFVRPTVAPPVGAAFDSVTVQVALPFEPRALGAHCSVVTVAEDCNETVADEVDPFSDPVSVAV